MSHQSKILLEKVGNIALVTLNHPDKLNAFDTEMRDLLYDALKFLRDDITSEGVVIKGNGKGFCAGADLTEFGTEPSVIEKRNIRFQHNIWDEMRRFPKPIAAALHGFAVGSGLEIAMLCDIRFASPGTKLSLPEAKIGMIPAAGGTQSSPRLMRHGHALEFALSGKRITAEEGKKVKLIHKIIDEEALIDSTIKYMQKVVRNSPMIVSLVKTLVTNGLDMPLSQGLAHEKILAKRAWGI